MRIGSRHEVPLLDRIIKLLVFALGALLIFLFGHFVATFGDDEPRPVPPSASSTEPPVDKPEQGQIDLPTKRVKTIVVRPEDLSAAPGTP